MPPSTLSSLFAVLLSLACSYIPGLAPRYASLTPTAKRLVMLLGLLLITLASFALSCLPPSVGAGLVPAQLTCTQTSALDLARTFLLALIANQSTYLISPKLARSPLPKDLKL